MEQWKIVLANNVYNYGKYYGTKGYAVALDTNNGELVYAALYEGIDALSSDYKSITYSSTDPNKIIIRVGSTQAQDEFFNRLANVISEAKRYQATGYANEEAKLKAELEAKQAELEAKQAELANQETTDTWGIIMVLCVAAALIILLTD